MFFEVIFAKSVLIPTSQGVCDFYVLLHEHLCLQLLEWAFVK